MPGFLYRYEDFRQSFEQPVATVYKMIVRNSIEDKILEMQAMKRDLADQILSGDALSSSTITREDLMQILS